MPFELFIRIIIIAVEHSSPLSSLWLCVNSILSISFSCCAYKFSNSVFLHLPTFSFLISNGRFIA